jgi:hypothetical protein
MTQTPRDKPAQPAPDQGGLPSRDRQGVTDVPGSAQRPEVDRRPDGHEGATEDQVSDRTGPGVGYDQEPEPETGEAGVS